MSTDDGCFCQRCEREYYLRPDEDPTPYCDHCAHEIVAEVTAEVERLRAELDAARAELKRLRELAAPVWVKEENRGE